MLVTSGTPTMHVDKEDSHGAKDNAGRRKVVACLVAVLYVDVTCQHKLQGHLVKEVCRIEFITVS